MGADRRLTDAELRAWRGFHRMRIELLGAVNRRLAEEAGLSGSDFEVLLNLSHAPDGSMRSAELGEHLQWEKSRLSHQLIRMQRRGMVTREPCAQDGRSVVVTLTDDGRDTIRAVSATQRESVRHYFVDALTPAQLDALADISDAVLGQVRRGWPAATSRSRDR